MSFHESAREVRVEDGRTLVADLRNDNGDFVNARLDLNTVLGNNDGRFCWGGGGFSDSASDIYFQFDQPTNLPILRAKLTASDGSKFDGVVNLSERITNNNGSFEFTP
ncbi:hypothetical protein MferCBS31731_001310 [Microsporum ferrugineum]